MSERAGQTLVIGLGNPLMGDDGVGLAALERLEREWRLPADVRPVDGGTLGLSLLPLLEDAEAVVLLDAIDAGHPPGALVIIERDDLPRALTQRISCHQASLPEVLAVGELRGTLPPRLVALGLQPGRVEVSGCLSAEVQAGLDHLLHATVARLAAWGHGLSKPVPAGALRHDAIPAQVR
jgi:hydrogenase maturation protease